MVAKENKQRQNIKREKSVKKYWAICQMCYPEKFVQLIIKEGLTISKSLSQNFQQFLLMNYLMIWSKLNQNTLQIQMNSVLLYIL